jgi:hypothetical protein
MPTTIPSLVAAGRVYTFQQNQKLTALANSNIGGFAESLMLRNGGDDIFRQPISVVIAVTSRSSKRLRHSQLLCRSDRPMCRSLSLLVFMRAVV